MNKSNTANAILRSPWAALGALALVLLTGVLVSVGAAEARPWRRGGPCGGHGLARSLMHGVHGLDLSLEQEVQAVRIRRALRQERQALRQALLENVSTGMSELGTEEPSPEKLRALVGDALERIEKSAYAAVDQLVVFHASLSPEQKAKLTERLEAGQARLQKCRERGPAAEP